MQSERMKVVISSKSFGKTGDEGIQLLKDAGLNPVVNKTGKKLNEDEIIEMAKGAVGIIAGTEKITGKVISQTDSLKVISRYGIGIDNVDLDTASKKGVIVYNTPEAPVDAVAELTLSLILNLLRKIQIFDTEIKKGVWKPKLGNLLADKTVGILGLGKIGKQVVRLLEPFNVKILAYELDEDEDFTSKYNVNVVSLEEVLKNSDIVSIHLPSTKETKHIINKNTLSMMKESAILINTARGDLVEETALYESLKNKKIAGAALDVFEEEPYDGKLKELDNTILTPHIGSSTAETRKNMDVESVNNLIKGLKEADIL